VGEEHNKLTTGAGSAGVKASPRILERKSEDDDEEELSDFSDGGIALPGGDSLPPAGPERQAKSPAKRPEPAVIIKENVRGPSGPAAEAAALALETGGDRQAIKAKLEGIFGSSSVDHGRTDAPLILAPASKMEKHAGSEESEWSEPELPAPVLAAESVPRNQPAVKDERDSRLSPTTKGKPEKAHSPSRSGANGGARMVTRSSSMQADSASNATLHRRKRLESRSARSTRAGKDEVDGSSEEEISVKRERSGSTLKRKKKKPKEETKKDKEVEVKENNSNNKEGAKEDKVKAKKKVDVKADKIKKTADAKQEMAKRTPEAKQDMAERTPIAKKDMVKSTTEAKQNLEAKKNLEAKENNVKKTVEVKEDKVKKPAAPPKPSGKKLAPLKSPASSSVASSVSRATAEEVAKAKENFLQRVEESTMMEKKPVKRQSSQMLNEEIMSKKLK